MPARKYINISESIDMIYPPPMIQPAAGSVKRESAIIPFQPAPPAAEPAKPTSTPSPFGLAGSRVLIVDDDRINVRILEGILQSEGFEFAAAESGERALELYEAFKPDLVLLDVVMPGLDGFQTCRELRRRHGHAAAPVIFITARAESEDVVTGFTAGGVDYLPKPFRPKEAVARIRTHLQNRQLLEDLTSANAAKNRFLGMCAHDLRSPLASIRGLAEFLQDPMMGELTADQRDLAATIETTAQSMLQLVNELLDVATIEAGELRVERQPCDFIELIKKAVFLANLDAARKNTRIELTDKSPAAPIALDPNKIRQVLANLLSNAVKYSPPASFIRVSFSCTGHDQTFTVLDQGPGIPEGERDQLFKDFGRLSTKPTGGEKSTGLGLAICRKIVAAHQGSISADNHPAGGCAFSVTLPTTA
jgi:two-component system, sensor histidine kinase and response regulator